MSQNDPSAALAAIQKRLNRLFEESLQIQPETTGLVGQAWTPPMDVFETDDELVVTAEIPGIDPDAVQVDLDDNVLRVKGERPGSGDGDTYHRMERHYGAFERTFELPAAVDAERVEAHLTRGVLTVRLPKRAGSPGRSIHIEVGE